MSTLTSITIIGIIFIISGCLAAGQIVYGIFYDHYLSPNLFVLMVPVGFGLLRGCSFSLLCAKFCIGLFSLLIGLLLVFYPFLGESYSVAWLDQSLSGFQRHIMAVGFPVAFLLFAGWMWRRLSSPSTAPYFDDYTHNAEQADADNQRYAGLTLGQGMNPLKLRMGPLLSVVGWEGWLEFGIATDEQIADSTGFYIEITNTSKSKIWIENIFFVKGPSDDERSLNPIFSNRSQSYPTRLPVSVEPGITVSYAVGFSQIPKLMENATGIRIRYRHFYLPLPIYRHIDSSDKDFLRFIAALRIKFQSMT